MARLSTIKEYCIKLVPLLALLIPLLIPIRLSLTYAVLIPSLVLFAFFSDKTRLLELYKNNKILISLHIFIFFTAISAFCGVNPIRSLRSVISLIFFSFLILLFDYLTRKFSAVRILLALLCGQAFAALFSIIEGGTGISLGRILIGPVSESGQIALTLPTCVAVLFYLLWQRGGQQNKIKLFILSIIPFTLFLVVAFAQMLKIPALLFWVAATCSVVITFYAIFGILRYLYHSQDKNWSSVRVNAVFVITLLAMVVSALLINLKRGPWFGVVIALIVFFSLFRRRIIVPLCIVIVCLLMVITPARSRLQDSIKDFNISGGRNIMWQVGVELSTRYPLGIGYANSDYQQQFSPEIPKMHRHFHNNFINILVECGWLAFTFFLYWLVVIFRMAFKIVADDKYRILKVGIGCAVLSMLCAGLVEYNFGDSEVCWLLFLLLGVLSGLDHTETEQ